MNKIIAIFLFSLLAAGLASAQSRPYDVYTDRATWVKAVLDAGITPAIGTQTFQSETILVGLYSCPAWGGIGYGSLYDCLVSVSRLNDGNKVIRPSAYALLSGIKRAIGFDVIPEGGCGKNDATTKTQVDFLNGALWPGFIVPGRGGFIGIISNPGTIIDTISVMNACATGTNIALIDNVSYPGGPDSSLDNPNPPVPCPAGVPPGTHCFTPPAPIGPAWYDPPATDAFDFSSPNAKFISINDFPPGFASPFTVTTGGVVLGSFMPGQSVQFPNGGVNAFRISGISPAVDGDNPYAFPINLSLDKAGVVFTMRPASTTCESNTSIAMQPVSQTLCLGATASFSVAASGTGPFTYQWRKNGSNIPGAINNSFSVASVVAGDAGSYDVVVTGACGSVNSSIANLSVNLPPTANAGGPYTVNEGSSITVTASGIDPEGGLLTFAWDLDNNGSFETSGQSATFSAAALDGPSSRSIRLQVTDNCNLPATASATIALLNVAPAVGAIIAPGGPIPATTTLTPSASFTDTGKPDTHTALWNWDDPANPSSAGAVTETNGSGSVSGSHLFTTAGVYEVKLTVTDDDGGASQSIFQYAVVYDPNGGFVTGGGWIDSPAGAYGPDPTLIGKANFGFVSKYQPGANVPTGNTEFQFKAGNFNFHSTVYEWLVVAGAKAQYKGSGKVNGAGDYGFMLTATDGQLNGGGGVDKFRIKIWDKASGVVIYDNKRGDSDDLDNVSPQALGGGSIVIHKDK